MDFPVVWYHKVALWTEFKLVRSLITYNYMDFLFLDFVKLQKCLRFYINLVNLYTPWLLKVLHAWLIAIFREALLLLSLKKSLEEPLGLFFTLLLLRSSHYYYFGILFFFLLVLFLNPIYENFGCDGLWLFLSTFFFIILATFALALLRRHFFSHGWGKGNNFTLNLL